MQCYAVVKVWLTKEGSRYKLLHLKTPIFWGPWRKINSINWSLFCHVNYAQLITLIFSPAIVKICIQILYERVQLLKLMFHKKTTFLHYLGSLKLFFRRASKLLYINLEFGPLRMISTWKCLYFPYFPSYTNLSL